LMLGAFVLAIVLLNHEPGSQHSSPLTEVKLLDAKREARQESRPVRQTAPQVEKVPGKYEYRGRSYDIDPDTYTHWIHGRRVLNVEVIPGSSHFDITKVKRGMIGYEHDRVGSSGPNLLYNAVMHFDEEITHDVAMIIAERCVWDANNTTQDIMRQMQLFKLASLHDTFPELQSDPEFMSVCTPDLLAEGRRVVANAKGSSTYFEEERMRQMFSPENIERMKAETEANLARGIPPVTEDYYRGMTAEKKLALIRQIERGGHAAALEKVVYWENRQQTDPHSEPETRHEGGPQPN